MIRLKVFCVLLTAMVVSGCSSGRAHSKYILFSDPLDAEVKNWTRSAKLYRQFDTNLIIDTIYNSQMLRKKWVERVGEVSRMSGERKKRLHEDQSRENSTYAQFFVAVYTPYDDWNNLADPDSKWSVFLSSDAEPIRPVSIEKVSLDSLPWSANLPFEPNFRTFYLISFLREKAGFGAKRLVISSLLGEVKFSWESK